MRIGLIAPPWIPVPPERYGGAEEVIDGLARALGHLGHEVRLFTLGDSTCPVPRDHYFATGIDPTWSSTGEAAHVLAAYESLADVDVVHDHTVLGPLLAERAGMRHPPVVVTQHSEFTRATRRVFTEVARSATIVAISHDQARRSGPVRIDAVVHHGIDLDAITAGPGDGGYLLFIGRMTADKGVDTAVRIARTSDSRLVIAAKMHEPEERDFFEEVVQPLLGPDVAAPIEPGPTERNRLLRHATALIDPIRWAEPFGLVMVEALAAGTPVVAFPHGAAPEIVRPGTTGFLPEDEEAALESLRQVPRLSRAACRRDAEERFSMERMARDYERIYQRVLDGDLPKPSVPPPRSDPVADHPAPIRVPHAHRLVRHGS